MPREHRSSFSATARSGDGLRLWQRERAIAPGLQTLFMKHQHGQEHRIHCRRHLSAADRRRNGLTSCNLHLKVPAGLARGSYLLRQVPADAPAERDLIRPVLYTMYQYNCAKRYSGHLCTML
jgi:hypothetical protein